MMTPVIVELGGTNSPPSGFGSGQGTLSRPGDVIRRPPDLRNYISIASERQLRNDAGVMRRVDAGFETSNVDCRRAGAPVPGTLLPRD
jgi:hypothetical protein